VDFYQDCSRRAVFEKKIKSIRARIINTPYMSDLNHWCSDRNGSVFLLSRLKDAWENVLTPKDDAESFVEVDRGRLSQKSPIQLMIY